MNRALTLSVLILMLGCSATPTNEPASAAPSEPAPTPAEPMPGAAPAAPGPLPRVLVAAPDGEDLLVVQVEQAFQDAGFETIDATQLASIQDVDAALHAGDPNKLAALLGRPGAELVVLCEPEDGGYSARVVHTDTLLRLTSGLAAGPNAASELGQQLAEQSREQWALPRDRRVWYQVFVSQVDASIAAQLVERIGGQPGVRNCNAFRLRQRTSELEVGFEGSVVELVSQLMEVPGLQVVSFEARKIEAAWAP